jgi:L,D-peptidoglycan transpeptidase YkuD (ErfK/YbiS/YcfS/YnhG family)
MKKPIQIIAAFLISTLCLSGTVLGEGLQGPGVLLSVGATASAADNAVEAITGTLSAVTAAAPAVTAAAPTGMSEQDQQLAARLAATKTAEKTDQIILLTDHRLTLWNRLQNGSWEKSMDTYAGYGRNGLKEAEKRQEGDGTTPVGSFPILFAFGNLSNPGTSMTWRDVTPNSYWSGEESSYNTWVESPVKIAGEHLSEYTICYKYCLAVGFNTDPTVYKRGSAIFVHCKNPETWSSSGCISLTDEDMLQLTKAVHNGCYMLIVPDEASIAAY